METSPTADQDSRAIAIIGMAGRFGHRSSTGALWDLLIAGGDAVGDAPPDREWLHQLEGDGQTPGRIRSSRGGYLGDLTAFDAPFFGISAREAHRMDPQLRMLLEVGHECLEDAGLVPRATGPAPIGVFIGSAYNDYWTRQIWDLEDVDIYTETGGTLSFMSGRLSYAFDFSGPALTVDAACSSALLSVYLAVQSLRAGECEMALAGGSNVLLSPYHTVAFSGGGAHSPDGRCKFGDAAADGYGRGEAVGLVMLKPLPQAVADGDRIRAVILGGACGHVGFTGQGILAPSATALERTMRRAFRDAGIDPAEIRFVEAHGTGTRAGDTAELTALTGALDPRPETAQRCLVSSVKANLGHAEAAAGVVGLVKSVLCLENRMMPRSLHQHRPTPSIDWDTAPIALVPQTVALAAADEPVLAGVNSLGASGTGVHLVLRTAPPREEPAAPTGRAEILTISARSKAALRELTEAYRLRLTEPGVDIGRLCAGAATKRRHWEHRAAVVADTASGLSEDLSAYLDGAPTRAVRASAGAVHIRPKVVFVFPGQGAQSAGAGRELLTWCEPFRAALDECDEPLRTHLGWSLVSAIESGDETWLERTGLVQPALWALAVALSRTWRAWGVEPDTVLGQSQGEIAAACASGALSIAEAGALICRRAELLTKSCPPGVMARLPLSAEETAEFLRQNGIDAYIAVESSPSSVVVSGEPAELDKLERACVARGIDCLRIRNDYAAHSPLVEPARESFLAGLAAPTPKPAVVPMFSTVTVAPLTGAELDTDYWWHNVREPVRLGPALAALMTAERTVFLQMSPHPLLTTSIEETAAAAGAAVTALASMRRGKPERAVLFDSLGALYAAGCDIAWDRVYDDVTASTELPHHPWQRKRYWHQSPNCPWPEPDPTTPAREAAVAEQREYRHSFGPAADYVTDHRVAGESVVAGTGYIAAALGAAREIIGSERFSLRDIRFDRMMPIAGEPHLRVVAEPKAAAGNGQIWALSIGREGDDRGYARAVVSGQPSAPGPDADAQARARCTEWHAGEEFYRALAARGNEWFGAFRRLAEFRRGTAETIAFVRGMGADAGWHPALLDACLQTALIPAMDLPEQRGVVLAGIDRLALYRPAGEGRLECYIRQREADADLLAADITVLDARGVVLAEFDGVRAVPIPQDQDLASEAGRQAVSTMPGSEAGATTSGLAPGLIMPMSAAFGPMPTGAPTSGLLQHGPVWTVPSDGVTISAASPYIESSPTPDSALAAHTVVWREIQLPAPDRAGGTVLLMRGATALDDQLAARLLSAGYAVETADPASMPAQAPRAIMVLAALSAHTDPDASAREIQWIATDLCTRFADLARHSDATALYVVTRGACAARPEDTCPAPWQAALWGMAPVASREEGRRVVLVDLDPDSDDPAAEANHLTAVLRSAAAEDRLALRGGQWLAPRLIRQPESAPGEPAAARSGAVRLRTDHGIDRLEWTASTREAPAQGQIEIAVSHTGINFHDILALTGLDPDTRVGWECAGTVAALGPGAERFAVGDRVLAMAPGLMGSHVVVDQNLAVPMPHGMEPAAGAALPIAYATAYYALVELGQLRAGERVLIHSATGGLGMAAIAIARWIGATIYATAGSEAKRNMLRQWGIEHVADSRTLDFADRFRAPGTDGRGGIDVILNTLAGDALDANFALLNPHGRFVDVTIMDVDSGRPLPMNLLARGRSYHHVQLIAMAADLPARVGALLSTVTDLIAQGKLTPLPYRVFPPEDAADAFALMRHGGHTGKLVLEVPRAGAAVTALRPDATYLVTGGLSGVGALASEWLIERGARHLMVLGRSEVDPERGSDDRAACLRRLRSAAIVEYAAVDVADEAALAAVRAGLARRGRPAVAGIIHAAAVLNPASVADLDAADIDRELRPKVAGSWALSRQFGGDRLDFFLMFSSVTASLSGTCLGYQLGGYTAGNAFIDAFAVNERAGGRSATAVIWGYWTETGLAARLSEQRDSDVRPTGMLAIRSAAAPALFDRMLRAPGPTVILAPADWSAFAAAYPTDAATPLLREIMQQEQVAAEARPPAPPAPEPAAPAIAPDELADYLVVQIASVLGVSEDEVDSSQPVDRLGLDSLMAADVRNRLRRDHDRYLTISELLTAPSLRELARTLAAAADASSPAPQPSSPPAPATPVGTTAAPDTETKPVTESTRAGTSIPIVTAAPASTSTESGTATPATPAGTVSAAELTDYLATQIAAVLGISEDEVDRGQPMDRLGLDSLMAADVRNRLRRDHDRYLTISELLTAPSLRELARTLAESPAGAPQ
ncbi:type I polyketide synthase [Nocardia panacis]|nr:type I polyketide synthase [Nocardia panacis]